MGGIFRLLIFVVTLVREMLESHKKFIFHEDRVRMEINLLVDPYRLLSIKKEPAHAAL